MELFRELADNAGMPDRIYALRDFVDSLEPTLNKFYNATTYRSKIAKSKSFMDRVEKWLEERDDKKVRKPDTTGRICVSIYDFA